MIDYTLEILQEHIDDYLDGKADARTEDQLMEVYTMATSIRNAYKKSSAEHALLTSFSKKLLHIRSKRFPKTVKPVLRELPDDPKQES